MTPPGKTRLHRPNVRQQLSRIEARFSCARIFRRCVTSHPPVVNRYRLYRFQAGSIAKGTSENYCSKTLGEIGRLDPYQARIAAAVGSIPKTRSLSSNPTSKWKRSMGLRDRRSVAAPTFQTVNSASRKRTLARTAAVHFRRFVAGSKRANARLSDANAFQTLPHPGL